MKFIDIAPIYIKSGDGGNGHISFRKEKFVPKGGPDGGNGGRGGDVIFKVSSQMNTLVDFKFKRKFLAKDGKEGGKARRTGRDGKSVFVKVPIGTVVKDLDDNILADLSEPNQEVVIAKGGNGGWGNSEFQTATNQTPRNANPGLPGIELDLILELKVLADIGIVGFPNAGKSTLISVISAAKPKIADYPFTTLVPNLGIVKIGEGQSFTIADIPGLIEGASDGKGLGAQFLRHVERCKVLLFLIDSNSMDPLQDYNILKNELERYNPDMLYKKRIICFSKADTIDKDLETELLKTKFESKNKAMIISASTHYNVDILVNKIWKLITENN